MAKPVQTWRMWRSKQAFKPSVLADGVIAKCAAYAAREHGDARRALELLRVSAELAERTGTPEQRLTKIDVPDSAEVGVRREWMLVELRDELAMLLGGRTAEELLLAARRGDGPDARQPAPGALRQLR